MNIEEATERLGVTKETVIKYIAKGYIDCLECNGNQIILPDIPKLYKTKKNYDSDSKIIEAILKACDNNQYLSAYMLGISSERFTSILDVLLNNRYLEGEAKCGASNMGYHITPKRANLKKGASFTLNINIEGNELNLNNQIGFINFLAK